MKEIVNQIVNQIKSLRIGEIVNGKIIGVGRSSVFIDLTPYGTGIIYGKEFFQAKDILKNLKIGDTVAGKVIELENENGYIELSLKEADIELTLVSLKEKKEKGENIKVKILKANKGGLVTEISGMSAFLPVSQLSPEHYPKVEEGDKSKILIELQQFIGKELEVKILDLDLREGKLILSEKAKDTEKLKEDLKKYKSGDIIEGKISGITDFGAFIKFDKELEGLIHISELDWQLINNPSEIVKVGDKVKAKIIEISNNKIFLSLKALKEDPWIGIEKKYKKTDIVKGKITKFNPFGAFVQIEPKIQGLIHVSEFGTAAKMKEMLELNKDYNFQILLINPKQHRMSLKLKRFVREDEPKGEV